MKLEARHSMRSARPGSQCGFSLIEVLIAFVIPSLAMAALLPALSGGLVSERTAGGPKVGATAAPLLPVRADAADL